MRFANKSIKRKAIILISVFIVLAVGLEMRAKLLFHPNDEFPFAEQHDLSFPDYLPNYHGYSKLTVNRHLIVGDKVISCDINFFNRSDSGGTFYNPFYIELFDMPVKLAVYDIHHKYVRDLLEFRSISHIGGGSPVSIPSLGNIGATVRVQLDNLSLGLYYLQVICLKGFIFGYNRQAFQRNEDGEELFRSNFVRIIIL